MPALPFFSALAPAPMANQGPATQGNSQSTPMSSQSISVPVPGEASADGSLDSEQGASFLQQFEMATEGQELAVSLPAFSQAALTEVETDVDTELETEILLETSLQDGATQMVDPVLSPWAVNPLSTDKNISGEVNSALTNNATAKTAPVIAMSDLETQRQAMPKLQVNAGESMQPQALQAREMNLQQVNSMQAQAQAQAQPQIVEGEVAAPLAAMTPIATNKTMQADSKQPLTDTISNTASTEGTEADGFKLELTDLENEMADENIHEKPITLQPREAILKPVVGSPMETLAMQQPDSLEGVQGPQTAQTAKTSAVTENLQSKQAEASTEKTQAQFKVDVPPQNPQWNDQVAKRIGIMASEQMQTARIQLDPPELGALEVKIKVQHDQVSVAFASNHGSVRDALESQAPRLREMLEQQGVELTDVSVSDQQQGQSREQAEGSEDGFAGNDDALQDDSTLESVTELESDSLVDYFA